MTEKRGVSRRPKVVIYVRILMINGYVRTCTGRKGKEWRDASKQELGEGV